MKSFKTFCEEAFHPDLVNKLSDPKVQKNLRSTVIPPGQRYASGPPAMKPQMSPKPQQKEKGDYARGFVGRLIRNTISSPIQ
jgi:hypothetical protein